MLYNPFIFPPSALVFKILKRRRSLKLYLTTSTGKNILSHKISITRQRELLTNQPLLIEIKKRTKKSHYFLIMFAVLQKN